MNRSTELRLQQIFDKEDIRNALSLYARAIDRCDEQLLRQIYWPDATDDHDSFSGRVDEFIAGVFPLLRSLKQTHHHLSNPNIAICGDIAESETYFIAYHHTQASGSSNDYIVGGRYIDRFERRNHEWRISRRITAFDYSSTAETQSWDSFNFSNMGSIGRRKPYHRRNLDRTIADPEAQSRTVAKQIHVPQPIAFWQE